MLTINQIIQSITTMSDPSQRHRERLECEVRAIWGEKGIETAREISVKGSAVDYPEALIFIQKQTGFTLDEIKSIINRSCELNISVWECADLVKKHMRPISLKCLDQIRNLEKETVKNKRN